MLGNEKDSIATRVAHKLDLTGPAISVHTGCSTSLVAICQAVDSLRAGRCGMALAGGASITCPPASGYRYQEGSMLSPDGHTRTFDAGAKGTVFSDGAAVVLLKRLSDAVADGNEVIALIRGCAVNNDGSDKASFTAPSVEGQAALVAMALDDANVDARSIGYVEAHGTATPLGDPIEIEGLTKAFRRQTADAGFCRIGSAKSNVGHLVIAGGAPGVTKTALSPQARSPGPGGAGQAALVAWSLYGANVDARSICYVEAHGTATPLADPIEIEGLTKAFRRQTAGAGFCRIGSAKSNVGHLVIAAGATGVIKTALSLQQRCIPASLHFNEPNPSIDFAASPFVVNAAMTAWPDGDAPRRAGVSALGVGGTNAHVVMEQAPARANSEPARGPQLLTLSARTPAALVQAASRLGAHLAAAPDCNLADVAWTLASGQIGRAHV